MRLLYNYFLFLLVAPVFAGYTQSKSGKAIPYQPNIVWIVVEDMSEHWSCYGETTINTPNIDKLASEGELFENAFVTSPICSPSRSALLTGMYQTTTGMHNHRSQRIGGDNKEYSASYQLPQEIPFLPKVFKEAGYYTVLGNEQSIFTEKNKTQKLGKTDYNFIWDASWYDSNDWEQRQPGQPFFAQVQLRGGKFRDATVENPVDPNEVELPPYYPDDEVLRKDWAEYLNSVLNLDKEVKEVYDRLEAEGIADSTAVFLFTDHGISHLRGKQYLYDDGIKIPLIVKWPEVTRAGNRRKDLITQIDIAATSLYLAKIPIPEVIQGQSFYGENYHPGKYVFTARDRGDETVDLIRAVRSERFKYIRNFFPYKPHAQPNTYKDGKEIVQHMRQLYSEGRLKEETQPYFESSRPVEELYDLKVDPYEMNNLAQNKSFRDTLQKMQKILKSYIINTNDLGFLPEPVLEDLGKKYGNKYHVLNQRENRGLNRKCMEVMKLDEKKDVDALQKALEDEKASVRFWAAYGLGNIPETAQNTVPSLQLALEDNSDAVKIAAARALCRMGKTNPSLQILTDNIENKNPLVGMYAISFIEDQDQKWIESVMPAIKMAKNSSYGYTQRVALRLSKNQ